MPQTSASGGRRAAMRHGTTGRVLEQERKYKLILVFIISIMIIVERLTITVILDILFLKKVLLMR